MKQPAGSGKPTETKHRASGRKRPAFTLVELLIVIIIIGILAGSMMLVAGSSGDRATAVKIVQDMKTLAKASLVHYADTRSWPAASADVQPFIDREIASFRYDLERSDTEGWLYVKVGLNGDVPSGVKEHLRTMASSTGLLRDTGFYNMPYSGGDVAYIPVNAPAGTTAYVPGAADFEGRMGAGRDLARWKYSDGMIEAEGIGRALLGDPVWEDFELTTEAEVLSGAGFAIYYRSEDPEDEFYGFVPPSGYAVNFEPGAGRLLLYRYYTELDESGKLRSREQQLISRPLSGIEGLGPGPYTGPYNMTIRATGNTHEVLIDGRVVLTYTDTSDNPYASGQTGLRLWGSDPRTNLRDIVIRAR